MDSHLLHAAISAVCPIDGVSIGDASNKSTWRIDYSASATPAQKLAAQAAVTSFDPGSAVDSLDTWDIVSLKISFNHENRIRALEGKAVITAAQFKNAIRALL